MVIDIEPPGCPAKSSGVGGCVVTKKRLLFVDDNEDFCEIFQQGLAQRGFDVTVARSVNAALRLICVANFEVLFARPSQALLPRLFFLVLQEITEFCGASKAIRWLWSSKSHVFYKFVCLTRCKII